MPRQGKNPGESGSSTSGHSCTVQPFGSATDTTAAFKRFSGGKTRRKEGDMKVSPSPELLSLQEQRFPAGARAAPGAARGGQRDTGDVKPVV